MPCLSLWSPDLTGATYYWHGPPENLSSRHIQDIRMTLPEFPRMRHCTTSVNTNVSMISRERTGICARRDPTRMNMKRSCESIMITTARRNQRSPLVPRVLRFCRARIMLLAALTAGRRGVSPPYACSNARLCEGPRSLGQFRL